MRNLAIILATFCVVGMGATAAQAGPHHGHGHHHGSRGRAPVYHRPSVHIDRHYHVDYYHWTPRRGLHTHGHVHRVPHFVPGHYDMWHRGHIHRNPWYHH